MFSAILNIIAALVSNVGRHKPVGGRPPNLGAGWHYFDPDDFAYSNTAERHGIKNEPGSQQWINIDNLVINVLDPLREELDKPIIVNSGYRSPKVNALVGGSKNSQHMRGEAADIKVVGMKASEVFHHMVKQHQLPFDQLILEHGLVHVSHKKTGNRGQAKIERKVGFGKKRKDYIDYDG